VPNIWVMDANGANKTNLSNNKSTSATMPGPRTGRGSLT
jgi:hypothetical protein